MMKKLLAIALIMTTTACTMLQQEFKHFVNKPVVSYQSISVSKVAMDGIELNPTFNVSNKNAFPIPINNVSYVLSLNDKTMLTGQTNALGTLPANKNKDVTLSLALTKETLIALQQLLFKHKQLTYHITGEVDAMGLAIPFEESATLYVPEISIDGIEVISANFTQLDMLLTLNINNDNAFALPLEDITYSAASNNNALFDGAIKNQLIQKGNNRIQLPLSIKPNTLFSNIFDLLNNPVLPLHFEINTPLFHKSYDHSLNLTTFFLAKDSLNTFSL